MGKASKKRQTCSVKKPGGLSAGGTVAISNSVNGVGSNIRQADLDFSMPENAYSGTFRWAAGKKFMELPAACVDGDVDCSRGWGPWLSSRVPDAGIIERVKGDPSALDGLTYPVTAAFALRRMQYKCPTKKEDELTVVVLGAASRAEERVARETAYWGEIAVCMRCRVHVVMCGPEVSADGTLPNPNPDTRITLFRGTFLGYQERHSPSAADTVLVTYNGGFGNFVESSRFDLLESWYDDLCAIVASGIPAIFTQANDYADLNGESALMAHILGARFVALPMQNPFSAASHLSEPDRPDAWACANFSFYGVQGCDRERAITAKVDTEAGRQKLRQAVIKAVSVGCDMAGLQAMMTQLSVPSAGAAKKSRSSAAGSQGGEGLELKAVLPQAASSTAGEEEEVVPQNIVETLPVPAFHLEPLEDGVLVRVGPMPLLESGAGLDLELVCKTLVVSCEGQVYRTLEVQLPNVEPGGGGGSYSEDSITAKFDKATHELICNVGFSSTTSD